MSGTKYGVRGSTAVISLDNPPVNGLATTCASTSSPASTGRVPTPPSRPWSPRSAASAWAAAKAPPVCSKSFKVRRPQGGAFCNTERLSRES